VGQRVLPVGFAATDRIQEWLRRENEAGMNVYVSVNSVAPNQTSRRRAAVQTIRHVFVDVDQDGAAGLAMIRRRHDLPPPSYVLHTSRHRLHVLWRVTGFTCETSEALQRSLAAALNADTAATSCAQLTRVPGFVNHKYGVPYLISMETHQPHRTYERTDFPRPTTPRPIVHPLSTTRRAGAIERAWQYVAALPPAIAGQRGDVRTFRVCCRLARGFALSDAEAMGVLRDWNARCVPPWTDRELREKLKSARRSGREPVGGLLNEAVNREAFFNDLS
jgi:hypothetical protein